MWRFVIAGTAVVVGMGLLVTESYSDLGASVRDMWRQPPYTGPIIAPVTQKQPPQPEQLRDLQAQIAATSANLDRMREQEQTDILKRDALQQQLATLNDQIAQAHAELAQPKVAPQRKVIVRKTEARSDTEADSREAILARLRRPPPVAAPADTSPAPRERLLAARQALVEGRVTDAENLLQQAQTQMVFTPVTPQDGNSSPRPNTGASRIDRALERIHEGDVQRALNFIDQAMKMN